MYQTIRADMIFKHDKFRLPEQRQIFTALEEPRIVMGSTGDVVQLQVKMSGNKQRLLRLKYGSFVQVWQNDWPDSSHSIRHTRTHRTNHHLHHRQKEILMIKLQMIINIIMSRPVVYKATIKGGELILNERSFVVDSLFIGSQIKKEAN